MLHKNLYKTFLNIPKHIFFNDISLTDFPLTSDYSSGTLLLRQQHYSILKNSTRNFNDVFGLLLLDLLKF